MTAVRIVRLMDEPDRAAAEAAIEAIFFAASNTQTFDSLATRAAFRERWLGRYLRSDSQHVLLACQEASGAIVGYLTGCFDDPARAVRFADIGFYAQFAHLTERYPAHLHVNLDVAARSAGIGSKLVAAFVADVARAGLAGVHVVTGRGARNVSFYERAGFHERGIAASGGREVILLGRDTLG